VLVVLSTLGLAGVLVSDLGLPLTTVPSTPRLGISESVLGSFKALLIGCLLGYLLGCLFDKENKKDSHK
jgi:hypothetical protein